MTIIKDITSDKKEKPASKIKKNQKVDFKMLDGILNESIEQIEQMMDYYRDKPPLNDEQISSRKDFLKFLLDFHKYHSDNPNMFLQRLKDCSPQDKEIFAKRYNLKK